MPDIIALDVGGSSVKSARIQPEQALATIRQTPVDSKADADPILTTFADIVRTHLHPNERACRVGIGFPSDFDYQRGICLIRGVDKYEALYGMAIGAALQARIQDVKLDIRFRNDAEAALVGEARHGAGRAYQRFIGITLGTGMGSGFMLDGERLPSVAGISENGFLFAKPYQGMPADDHFSTRGLLRRFADCGKVQSSVAQAAEHASAGDTILQTAFHNFGMDLGQFLQPYLHAFGAQALLVTGGIAAALPLFQTALRQEIDVPVVRGSLGAQAALLGLASLF